MGRARLRLVKAPRDECRVRFVGMGREQLGDRGLVERRQVV